MVSKSLVPSAMIALCLSGWAGLSGCVAEGPMDTAEVTKDEARSSAGKSDHGIDFCELFDWYGDGECDEFCPNPDPDCESKGGCRADTDCPTIYCVRAPCPSNTCVAGACVIDNPEDRCESGERECQTCGDGFVCAPHGSGCPLVTCGPACGNGVIELGEECDGGPGCSATCEREGTACGGFRGDTCARDEYCAYEAGDYCGRADASAICATRPEACPAVYEPVCGCDGETYSNSCAAARAGTGVDREGACARTPAPTGCLVGGCSGQLCVEEGDPGFSTCEWRPEYACYADATCERQVDGACGWTTTPEFNSCLGSAACSTVRCSFGTRCEVCDGAPGCYLPGEGCE